MINPRYGADRLMWGIPLLAGIDLGIGLNLIGGTPVEMDALLMLLATAIGFLAAGAGLGGAILMVPVLLWLHREGWADVSTANIAGLASLGAMMSAYRASRVYRREKIIDRNKARMMGATGTVAALMTSLWSYHWGGHGLLALDLGVALLGTIFLWWRPASKVAGVVKIHPMRLYGGTALIGIISGVTGMPGSFLLIPLMLWSTPLPYRQVVATVLQVIFYLALISSLIRAGQHLIDWRLAIPIVIGSAIGSTMGSHWGLRMSPYVLRMIATVVIVLGVLFSLLPLI